MTSSRLSFLELTKEKSKLNASSPTNKIGPGPARNFITAIAFAALLGSVIACELSPSSPSTEPAESPQTATGTPPGNATPSEWKDLTYAVASPAEKLDLYIPAGEGPFPVVIYVHGGGFRQGDKRLPVARGIVDQLLNSGYAIATLNYRLSGDAAFPAQIQDVKTGVRWLHAHAGDYNLDPNRFAAWGDSAGANLVSLLGTSCGVPGLEGAELGNAEQPSCVAAVVDFYGPIDFLQMDQQFNGTSCPATHNNANSAESQYVGGAIQKNKDVVTAANPITYITADDPPFFIQHGTKDCTVPFQQSQLFYDALTPVIGADKVTLAFLQGADHGDQQFTTSANIGVVIDFLDKYLK